MSKKIHFRNTVNCQKFVVWFVLVRGARSFSAGVSDWLIWIWRSSFELNRNYCATMLQKSNSINSSIFKKIFVILARRKLNIWTTPLNCTWKNEQVLEITARVPTISQDAPLIKMWPIHRLGKTVVAICIC